YTDAAVAQRHKGFEQVAVTFDTRHRAGTEPSTLDLPVTAGAEATSTTDVPATESANRDIDTSNPSGDGPNEK
ncbi:MAG TPA: hypothetical protein VIQ02_07030, partial [Jiangellaceae bacterium]